MSVTIREQSERLKSAAAEHLPADVVAVFDRNIQDLLEVGIPSGAVGVGHTLESFTLNDATGTPITLNDLLEAGPAVVVFYRGGWCPYCNLALRTYQRELLPELTRFGARLVAISRQAADQSLSTSEKAEVDFTVLSDPGSRVARKIGIVFQPGDEVLVAQRGLGLDLTQVMLRALPSCPDPPSSSSTAAAQSVSWTSSPITRPAPRSPTSLLRSSTSAPARRDRHRRAALPDA